MNKYRPEQTGSTEKMKPTHMLSVGLDRFSEDMDRLQSGLFAAHEQVERIIGSIPEKCVEGVQDPPDNSELARFQRLLNRFEGFQMIVQRLNEKLESI